MVKVVCGEEASKKPTTVPLSNDTVQRRIVELSNDAKDQNCHKTERVQIF